MNVFFYIYRRTELILINADNILSREDMFIFQYDMQRMAERDINIVGKIYMNN